MSEIKDKYSWGSCQTEQCEHKNTAYYDEIQLIIPVLMRTIITVIIQKDQIQDIITTKN